MIIIINADNDNDIIPIMLREELWVPGGPGGPGGHGGFGHGLGPGGNGEEPKLTSGISIFWQDASLLFQLQLSFWESSFLWFLILLLSFINSVQAFWILLNVVPNVYALFDISLLGVGIL